MAWPDFLINLQIKYIHMPIPLPIYLEKSVSSVTLDLAGKKL